jgi:hypothetical protein
MSDPAKWVAYTIPISAPNVDTLVPIPTRFEKTHRTRFFVVTRQGVKSANTETKILEGAGPSQNQSSLTLKLLPLFLVSIGPKSLKDDAFLTDFGFQVFTNPQCWHIGGARS